METNKLCTVTLDEHQIAALLTLLEPSSQEPEDPSAEIYSRLSTAKRVARETYFINIYEVEQNYGGPEEGGWYYSTTSCVSINAFPYIDEAIRELEYIAPDYDAMLPEDVDMKALWQSCNFNTEPVDQSLFIPSRSDRYGNYTIIAIETMPAMSESIEKQQYK